ncbi:MAG: hypothetical protein WCQ99_11510, partial [Pseudomonadota bacterium]
PFFLKLKKMPSADLFWYEKKSKGLGDEFLRIFYACTTEIQHNPLLYRKIYKNFRRRLLKRFPYSIYFKLDKRNIVVSGLFHSARNPVTLEKEIGVRRQKIRPFQQ